MLVAGVEFGDGVSIALGVEEFHGAFGEVAAVSLWRIAARASASSEWRARAFRSRRRERALGGHLLEALRSCG